MSTTVEPMRPTVLPDDDPGLTYYATACQLCKGHCYNWIADLGGCPNSQHNCRQFPRLVRLWASDAQKAALQVSGIPEPMSDQEALEYCFRQCTWEESYLCDALGSCQHYPARRKAMYAGSQRDLQTSGVPDPMIVTHPGHVYLGDGLWRRGTPATGPSIRRALYGRPSRLARLGDWLDTTLHGDRVLWGLAVASVALLVGLMVMGR